MFEKIKYEVKDRVGVITVNIPKKKNAFDVQTYEEMMEVLQFTEADDNIRALILWGREDLFGAGNNFKDADNVEGIETLKLIDFLVGASKKFEEYSKPVIAAIGGYCLGGSFEIALSCDFRVISENAKIGLPEGNLGMIPCIGGTQRLARLIGRSKAKYVLFTSEFLSGEKAYDWGIGDILAPEGKLFDTAMEFAVKLANKSPLALRTMKRVVNDGLEIPFDEALVLEKYMSSFLTGSEDQKEGARAFAEKRAPVFVGR